MFSSACDKNNDEPSQPTSPTSNNDWQVSINGVNESFQFAQGIFYNQEFGALDYAELQITFTKSSGDALLLDIRNYEPQNHPVNEVIEKIYDTDGVGDHTECNEGPDANQYCDIAGAGYSIDETFLYDTFNHSSTSPGKIEITSCDASTLKLSGTFEFEVEEYIGATENLIISGSFSNVPYVVLY